MSSTTSTSGGSPAAAPGVAFEQYKQQFDSVCAEVDKRLAPYPIFQKIQEASGARPAHVVLSAAVFLLLFIMFGLGSTALCNLVGFVYPAYASFKALRTACAEDDKQWLTYWVVYAFFTVVESVTDALMHWVPFYYLAKILFLVWAMAPQTRGAERIFVSVIAPLIAHYETAIDAAGNGGKQSIAAVAAEFRQDAAAGLASLKQKSIAAAAGIGASVKSE